MNVRKVLPLFLIAGFFLNSTCTVRAQGGLSFDEEYLTFTLSRNSFQVNGIYVFSAKEITEHSILYPFPVDAVFGNAYDIKVKNVSMGTSVPYIMEKDSAGIRFHTIISGSSQFQIGYKQLLKSNRVRYILTTTKSWNKPLKFADYKLVVDSGIVITSFSMEPQKRIVQGGKTVYFWQKKDFMPNTDFEVQFK